MGKKAKTQRVAVYWDFENIHASLMDRLHGEGAYRGHRGQHPELVDFPPIMAYAASLGEVVLRKAYADWDRFRSYRRAMLDTAVEPILTLTRPGAKNSADMRLLTDAMDDLHRYPAITHVVVLSGDGDFLPLAQRIRSSGRQIIGIGVQQHTSTYWRGACNVFRDYESLVGAALPSPSTPAFKSNGKSNPAHLKSTQQVDEKMGSQRSAIAPTSATSQKCRASPNGATNSTSLRREVPGSRSAGKANGHPSTNLKSPHAKHGKSVKKGQQPLPFAPKTKGSASSRPRNGNNEAPKTGLSLTGCVQKWLRLLGDLLIPLNTAKVNRKFQTPATKR